MGLAPGTRLGQYEILAPVGAGGMGEVYRARDGRLGRDVAIKVLPGGVAGDSSRVARFEREARLLASLNHPGIAAVYGFEDQGDTPFIVMEFVPGDTLTEMMARGALPVNESLQLAQQIAEALESAHERGVVHRDLKPGNIKVTPDGKVKVLDLGLAKAFDVKSVSSDDMSQSPTMGLEHTRPGMILGTAEFMSPEQARGKSVDKRTDIWAFGCVLYEMLSGKRAFSGETISDVLAAILSSEPDWEALPHGTPSRIRELLERCLEKDVNRRLRDIGEARIAVEQASAEAGMSGSRLIPPRSAQRRHLPLWIAIGLAAILAALWIARPRPSPARAPAQQDGGRYLAVLFTDLSGQPRAQMYCDGLAATVRARLEGFPSVQVTPPSPDLPLSRAEADLTKLARSLGANLLLRGTVQRLGEQVRVTYALVDLGTARQIASGLVDGNVSDIFGIQDQLVERLRTALGVREELPEAPHLLRASLQSPGTQESYAEALGYLLRYDKETSVDAAIRILEDLSRAQPASALVQAALARAYLHKYTLTHLTSWAERAMAASDRAQQLSPNLLEVHVTRGQLLLGIGKPAAAREEFQNALAKNPRSVEATLGLAASHQAANEPSEAERAYRRAIELQPLSWSVHNRTGTFYFAKGNYPQAVAMFQKAVQLMPDSIRAHNNLGAAYEQMGRFEEAREVYVRSSRIQPNDGAFTNLGNLEYFRGRYPEAARAFEGAVRLTPEKALYWANLGDAYRWIPEEQRRSREAYRTAIGLGREQLSVNPRDAPLHATLAISYAKSGDLPKAKRHIQQALEIEPNNPNHFYQAAVVANLENSTEEALRWIERAVAAGIGSAQVRNEPEFHNLRDLPAFREALTAKKTA